MLSGHFPESRYLYNYSQLPQYLPDSRHECDGERKIENGESTTESLKSLLLPETRLAALHRFPYKR